MSDELAADTSPEALAVMDGLYAKMNPEQKLRRVRELTLAANQFSAAGLRNRHPGESEESLRRRLAGIRLGTALADAVFANHSSDCGGS